MVYIEMVMIAATITLHEPKDLFRYIDEGPINEWLLANVGTHAQFRDLVDEERPWNVEHHYRKLVYHFAREKDAVIFALRWL